MKITLAEVYIMSDFTFIILLNVIIFTLFIMETSFGLGFASLLPQNTPILISNQQRKYVTLNVSEVFETYANHFNIKLN